MATITITVTLAASQEIHARLIPTSSMATTGLQTVQSNYAVPAHVHNHSSLTGLGRDDHPQYLTTDRALDLIYDVLRQAGLIP